MFDCNSFQSQSFWLRFTKRASSKIQRWKRTHRIHSFRGFIVNFTRQEGGAYIFFVLLLFLTVFRPSPPERGPGPSQWGSPRILMNVRRYILRFPFRPPDNTQAALLTQWAGDGPDDTGSSTQWQPFIVHSDVWRMAETQGRHVSQVSISISALQTNTQLWRHPMHNSHCCQGLKFTYNLYTGQIHVIQPKEESDIHKVWRAQ